MKMKKVLMFLAMTVASLAAQTLPANVTVTTRSTLYWTNTIDPSRSGFAAAVTGIGVTNLFLYDLSSPTNAMVLVWQSITNAPAASLSFAPMLSGLPPGDYRVWLAARSPTGVYSDWAFLDFYNAGGVPFKPGGLSVTVSMTINAPK